MSTYLLWHHHQAKECRFAYAAWNGFQSPLRKTPGLVLLPPGRPRHLVEGRRS